MNREEIINSIKDLAKCQGFYSRLYDYILTDNSEEFISELESQNFKDTIDLILYLEQ